MATGDDLDPFRRIIRERRTNAGMTLSDLAAEMERRGVRMHKTSIAKIETTDRTVTVPEMACLADIFGTTMDALYGRRPDVLEDKMFLLHTLATDLEAVAPALRQMRVNLMGSATRLQQFDLDDEDGQLIGDSIALADGLGDIAARAAELRPVAAKSAQAEYFNPSPKKAPATKTPAKKATTRNTKGGKK